MPTNRAAVKFLSAVRDDLRECGINLLLYVKVLVHRTVHTDKYI